MISNCCGAKVAYEDFDKMSGLCTDCKEWCDIIDEKEEEPKTDEELLDERL